MDELGAIKQEILKAVANIPHLASDPARRRIKVDAYFVDAEETAFREDAFSVRYFTDDNGRKMKEISLHIIDFAALLDPKGPYVHYLHELQRKGWKSKIIGSEFWNCNIFRIDYTKPLPAISFVLRKQQGTTDRPKLFIFRSTLLSPKLLSHSEFGDMAWFEQRPFDAMKSSWKVFQMTEKKKHNLHPVEYAKAIHDTLLCFIFDHIKRYAITHGVPLVYVPNYKTIWEGDDHQSRAGVTGAGRNYENQVNLRNLIAYAENQQVPYGKSAISLIQIDANKQRGLPKSYGPDNRPRPDIVLEGRIRESVEKPESRPAILKSLLDHPAHACSLFKHIPKSEPEIFVNAKITHLEIDGNVFAQVAISSLSKDKARSPIYKLDIEDLGAWKDKIGEDECRKQYETAIIMQFWRDFMVHGDIPLQYIQFSETFDLRNPAIKEGIQKILSAGDPDLVTNTFPRLQLFGINEVQLQ